MSQLTTGAQVVRIIFLIFNVLFLLIGIALTAVGIYLIVEGDSLDFVTGSEYASGAALIIVAGGVTIVVTVIGFFGALGLWRPLLAVFIGLLVIIVVLEIVAGILGFVYRQNIRDELPDRMLEALDEYPQNATEDPTSASNFVDFVQEQFECCGVNGVEDWTNKTAVCKDCSPPQSCMCDLGEPNCAYQFFFSYCDNIPGGYCYNNLTLWTEGCLASTQDAVDILGYSVGGVGIAFGIFEIIGILTALGLICCINHSRKQTVV